MKICGFAGQQCPHAATATLRIMGIGDRSVCTEHHAWMESVGMAFRVLEPNAFVPAWRQRSLVRDESRVLA